MTATRTQERDMESEEQAFEMEELRGEETGQETSKDEGRDGEQNGGRNSKVEDGEHGDTDDELGLEYEDKEFQLFAPGEEKQVLSKLDKRVVLFIAGLYMLSFLDRSNIGNARIAGLERDLRLTSDQYEWLLTAFYITYIAFEWMALLFRIVPPHVYISVVVFSWGLIASTQSLVTSFPQLLTLRFLMGIGEAAFCGVPFYLSFFYRRSEMALRTGYFIAAAPLATSFASSLAWLITWLGKLLDGELDGDTGEGWIAAWRLLFLVEGFPSCIVAVAVWLYLPDGPQSASFLSRREKQVALLRLESERQSSDASSEKQHHHGGAAKPKLQLSEIWRTLRDPKCYLTAAMFFSANVAFSSAPVFLPTIIREMGFSAVAAQALSAPPYLVSFVAVLGVSALSDRRRERGRFIMLLALCSAAGYAFIVAAGLLGLPPAVRYLGIYPACVGFFCCVTLIITWTLNNQESDEGRGTGVAMLQLLGQCGPLLGTRLFPKQDGPLYVFGAAMCAAFMVLVCALAFVLRLVLARQNNRKRREMQQGDGEELRDAERLIGRSPSRGRAPKEFVYML